MSLAPSPLGLRHARLLLLALGLAVSVPASADTPEARADALVEEGAALGRKGEFAEAIARFQAADRELSRAIHSCNIGLAFKLWKRLPEAHLYLHRCVERATGPLPPWVERERAALAKALQRGDYTPVVVATLPAGGRVAVDGFASGDDFPAPLTVWLPPGEHVVRANAPGFREASKSVVASGHAVVRVTIALPVAHVLTARPVELELGLRERSTPEFPAVVEGPTRGPWPWVTLSLGIVAAGVGGAMHALAVDSRTEAQAFSAGPQFDTLNRDFEVNRGVAIGAYTLSAAVIGTALWLLLRPLDETE